MSDKNKVMSTLKSFFENNENRVGPMLDILIETLEDCTQDWEPEYTGSIGLITTQLERLSQACDVLKL